MTKAEYTLLDIKSDPKVAEWLTNIEATEGTATHYIGWMRVFCECVGKSPSELIQESIKGIKAGLLPAERNEGGYFSRFKVCLSKAGYAEKTYQAAHAAIKSFYVTFDIPLPKAAGRMKLAHPLQINNNFLTKDDIRKLYDNSASLREKAIILCMATSGMAIMEIVNLKMSMIKIDENGIGTIRHRRQKTGVDYITFISPEATQALKLYWDERNRNPETAIKGDNDYCFVSDAVNLKGAKLTTLNCTVQFRQLGEKLGFVNNTKTEHGVRGLCKSRSHTLRKFFASTLENAGMNKAKVDFMLGHFRSGSDIAYFNVDVELLKRLYIDFLPYLTFEKTITVTAKPSDTQIKEMGDMRKQMEEMQKQIAALLQAERVKRAEATGEKLNDIFAEAGK